MCFMCENKACEADRVLDIWNAYRIDRTRLT